MQSTRPISWRKKTLGQGESPANTATFKLLPFTYKKPSEPFLCFPIGNNPFLNSLNRVQETQHDSRSRFPLVEKVRVSAVFWSALRCPPPKGELRMAPNKRAWTSGARVPHPHPVSVPQSLRSSMHGLGDQPTIVPRQSWHLLQRFALQQKASKPERSIINRWLYAHPSEQTHSLGSSLKLGSPLKNKTCKQKKKGKLRYHPRILGDSNR